MKTDEPCQGSSPAPPVTSQQCRRPLLSNRTIHSVSDFMSHFLCCFRFCFDAVFDVLMKNDGFLMFSHYYCISQ